MARHIPKYGHHKPTGQARIWIHGRYVYLGKHGSKASREKYRRLIAEIDVPADHRPDDELTIVELVDRFMIDAETRYVKHGKQTSEYRNYQAALNPVVEIYGLSVVSQFGPIALAACRKILVERNICRRRINQHVYRIRRVFKWGVARQLVTETTWRALLALEGLRYGEARETAPVQPVPLAHVYAIEPHVSRQVWGMIQLQRLTGCRPAEATIIRGCDLNTTGPVWEYRPEFHKTEHHGRERRVFLGPHAQAVIKPFLRTELEAYLFSPREAREAWLSAVRQRKPQRRVRKPVRAPGERYTVGAYGHAIRKACGRAGVPVWSPGQLRHAAATTIRRTHGLEAAQVILGHARANVTEIYAQRDWELARRIAREMG